MAKPKTKQETKHLQAVADLGCIACAKIGIYDSPAEIHHIKSRSGIGRRSTHFETIPLCPNHHRNGAFAYHNSPKNFTESFGTQEELLEEVLEWLGNDGCPCGCVDEHNNKNPENIYARSNLFYM
tara:strand:- start:3126 stop:3500 length:375 start_codon:yes stop_codon:yes gene_type:complete